MYYGPYSDNLSTFTLLKQIAQIPQNLLLARVNNFLNKLLRNGVSSFVLDYILFEDTMSQSVDRETVVTTTLGYPYCLPAADPSVSR